MAKNKTRFKSLDVVNDDPRVSEVYQDNDGFCLWLQPGWTCDPSGAHRMIYVDTVKAILQAYKAIERYELPPLKD
jgi:hypothetical protein